MRFSRGSAFLLAVALAACVTQQPPSPETAPEGSQATYEAGLTGL